MPVYFATAAAELLPLAGVIAIASAGVLLGTLSGTRLLRRIPQPVFDRVVAAIVLALGVFMLWRAFR